MCMHKCISNFVQSDNHNHDFRFLLQDEVEQIDDDTYISLNPSLKKRKVKRVKLREEEHGSTKFKILSSKDQTKSCHISESVLNFRKAKTFGHLSKVKRESADQKLKRLTKMQLSGKNTKVC